MQHSKNNKFKARGLVPTAVFKQFQCNTCLRGPALTGAKCFCDLLLTSCGISVPLPNVIRWPRRYICASPNIYPSRLLSAKQDGLSQRLLKLYRITAHISSWAHAYFFVQAHADARSLSIFYCTMWHQACPVVCPVPFAFELA